ncbi:ribonuclease H-like domain-containing protein [Tanacetum coccineum]
MKCTSTIRQLTYDVIPDALDEYLQIGEKTYRDSCNALCKVIKYLYVEEYLRRPTNTDVKKLYTFHEEKHGYYLIDVIYLKWAVLVKSISQTDLNDTKRIRSDEPSDDNERDRNTRQSEDTNPSSFGVEDVYMKLANGNFDKSANRVCKLIKSLYGLKQAPRKWNEKLTYVLIENDFVQNDVVITGNNLDEINKVRIFENQRKYCLEVLAEFSMLAWKLIYLTHTRRDISYVVHVLSQYICAPMQSHLKLAFRALRYLKNSLGKGISFCKGSDLDLSVYVDSDWAKWAHIVNIWKSEGLSWSSTKS